MLDTLQILKFCKKILMAVGKKQFFQIFILYDYINGVSHR